MLLDAEGRFFLVTAAELALDALAFNDPYMACSATSYKSYEELLDKAIRALTEALK